MVTFDQLVDRAREGIGPQLEEALALQDHHMRALLERVVRSTIQGMGFHVTNDGEIGDPRPQPVINVPTTPRFPRRGRVRGL